jgi:hypothetical protein
MVLHTIYSEKIQISAPERIFLYEGDYSVFPVNLLARGGIGIGEGFITAKGDESILRLEWNSKLVPKSSDSAQSFPIGISALRPGKVPIDLEFKNAYGSTTAKAEVEVQSVGARTQVVKSNFSGSWNVRLGLEHGQMIIIDVDGKVSGRIDMDGSGPLTVVGIRDGHTFKVDLIADVDTKFVLDGSHEVSKSGDFIEIRSDVLQFKRERGGWVPTGNSDKFYATARLRSVR